MLRWIVLVWVSVLAYAPGLYAQDQQGSVLEGPMADLDAFVGTWTVSGTWSWGGTIVATATYEPGLNGRYLEVTTAVSDNGAPAYTRYHATLYHDESDGYRLFSKQHDGVAFGASMEQRDNANGTTTWVVRTERDGRAFEEELTIRDSNTVAWTVKMRQPDGSWMTMLDNALWLRDDAIAPAEPIDTSLFAEGGPGVRTITKMRTIGASTDEVYDAWATGEGVVDAWDPTGGTMVANIDQEIGGRYEWLFDGGTGSNGCRTLCYIPGRLICFSWIAPPGQATRSERTWVAVQIRDAGDGATEVTLSHAGFGEGDAWDETHDYFDRAWDVVLDAFERNLEG
ncbi:MAG: SRPBCC domain-containing protein [Planctomycetota bacterium]